MKLSTAHLRKEVERILNDEGLSPEELADAAGIHRSTVYAILNERNPTTQRAIGRKIAEAAGKSFRIEGDRIHFIEKVDDSDIIYSIAPDPPPAIEPPGLTQLRRRSDLRERFNITDDEIDIAQTSRFYGGIENDLTPEQWVEVVLLVKRLGLKKGDG